MGRVVAYTSAAASSSDAALVEAFLFAEICLVRSRSEALALCAEASLVLREALFSTFSAAKMGKGGVAATFCEVLIAILLPPLGVFLKYACGVSILL